MKKKFYTGHWTIDNLGLSSVKLSTDLVEVCLVIIGWGPLNQNCWLIIETITITRPFLISILVQNVVLACAELGVAQLFSWLKNEGSSTKCSPN